MAWPVKEIVEKSLLSSHESIELINKQDAHRLCSFLNLCLCDLVFLLCDTRVERS